jgi:hypothetical protein
LHACSEKHLEKHFYPTDFSASQCAATLSVASIFGLSCECWYLRLIAAVV